MKQLDTLLAPAQLALHWTDPSGICQSARWANPPLSIGYSWYITGRGCGLPSGALGIVDKSLAGAVSFDQYSDCAKYLIQGTHCYVMVTRVRHI
jgi:hypothetical protein